MEIVLVSISRKAPAILCNFGIHAHAAVCFRTISVRACSLLSHRNREFLREMKTPPTHRILMRAAACRHILMHGTKHLCVQTQCVSVQHSQLSSWLRQTIRKRLQLIPALFP